MSERETYSNGVCRAASRDQDGNEFGLAGGPHNLASAPAYRVTLAQMPAVRLATVDTRSGFPDTAQVAGNERVCDVQFDEANLLLSPSVARSGNAPKRFIEEVVAVQPSELDAIASLRAGNIGGLEVLVRLYQGQAMAIAFAVLGDRTLSQDVVADAFLAVYDCIGQFDHRRPFAPWFCRIVMNGALDRCRESKHYSPSDEPNRHLTRRPTSELGPEERVLHNELRHTLYSAIQSLLPAQRITIVLRYYLDMEERAIAELLHCPLGTVKWRLYSARRHLRRRLTVESLDGWVDQPRETPRGELT